ncbi:MAG: hypothetical protein J6U17_05120 [Kiritimatiellae bacterium]|nr:hypothetical protein [Kiritimatiellia bacterium]
MSKGSRFSRRGAALITVLVFTGVLTIAVGSVLGYVSNATRQTAAAVGRDICRLAAQSEIEVAKAAVNYRFQLSLNRSARIVGGTSIGTTTASSFDWFESYTGTSAKRTIGTRNPLTLENSTTRDGCTVRVRIGRVDHVAGSQFADVTLVAEATRLNPGGSVSRSVIAEKVRFAQQRSAVFNNAYFVNNYGWFSGPSIYANGDVRANGNMSLDNRCTINGSVYAAKNEELNVNGNISNRGTMDSYETYRTSQYGVNNIVRPLYIDPVSGGMNGGGYDAPANPTTADMVNRLHPNEELSVEMPYIGDISSSDSEIRAWVQELHDADPNMCTIKQGGQMLVSVYHDGVGPSGEATAYLTDGTEIVSPDYGAIVLEGTQSKPIEINGPVIIPSDVIIKGYVKGQGTIYSGRNIHIVGNIQYVNPPQWEGKSTANSDNSTKDMLGLMAKGNIVLGDCTSSDWLSDIKNIISTEPYVQHYACDTSDAAIGYPATFGETSKASYAAEEHVGSSDFNAAATAGLADFVPGGYNQSTGKFGKITQKTVPVTRTVTIGYGWHQTTETRTVYETRNSVDYNRKYYQTVCFDSEIKNRCKSSITRIDAVLYNNHGIFGKIGACSINGSLVCRNEGIKYSGSLYLNWDSRLYSGSSESVDNDVVGLARSSDSRPMTLWWMELPQDVISFETPTEPTGD